MSADEKTRIMAPPDPVAVGTRLSGIYELDQRLASGGMGEVFKGHNIESGDPVAIKIVLPEFARDQTILSLFRKEARVLGHLSHEAIVRYHVFAIDQAIGRPYLAMEYVDGVSLVDMIKSGPMSATDSERLLLRLAAGLAAAHEAGVIHRDLSPDNVVLPGGKVERAKIIDFGIAKSAGVGGETLIGGAFAGKYNYVSPEQLGMAGGEVTDRSDIYSLGLVIASASRGEPFNMSGSQVDVIEKRRRVPDLTGVDPDLVPVIGAMLAPEPQNRPASMAEIADWTRQLTDSKRGRAVLPGQAPAAGTEGGIPASAWAATAPPAWTTTPAQTAAPAWTSPPQPASASQQTMPPTHAPSQPPQRPMPGPVSESPFGPYTGPSVFVPA